MRIKHIKYKWCCDTLISLKYVSNITFVSQGSELGSWTLGHWTEDGHDIFQNFPDINNILWDAEDKGMVPKLTPNHHVPIPEGILSSNGSVRKQCCAIYVHLMNQSTTHLLWS